MILPDVNLLLYAEIAAYPQHDVARRWWESVLNGSRPVGLAPVVVFGFIRVSTGRRTFTQPLHVDDAVARCQAWLARPQVTALSPGPRYYEHAFAALRALGTGGNLTSDVQLVAHALECGGEIFSNDTDFARFDGIKVSNPLKISG